MSNLKSDTKEPTYETGTDSQMGKQTCGCKRKEARRRDGVLVWA